MKSKQSINNLKLLKSRWRFLLVTIASGILFIVLPTMVINYYSKAAPYRPPPPPAPKDDPLPPPDDQEPRKDEPKFPEFIATPTPCLPNWCFVKQTECCFDPICVFLSETDKMKNNRCPKPKAEEGQYLGSKKPANLEEENPNIFYSIYNLFFTPKKDKK